MIDNPQQQHRLLQVFPLLAECSDGFRQRFFRHASLANIPPGHTIASTGSECSRLALVVKGRVRVFKLAESGREITLYRIGGGDSCVLTASCIMSGTPFPAIATSESDVEALILPARLVYDWVTESKPWAAFIFGLVSRRLVEVIAVLEDVAFHHMNERIAAYLIALAAQGSTLAITHQQIADDLGTTREVVSRILKEFEGRGLIQGARGRLTIADLTGLQAVRGVQ